MYGLGKSRLSLACLSPAAPAHARACVLFTHLQDYIDSMEGATLSGRQCAYSILNATPGIQKSLTTAARPLAGASA